MEYDMLAVMYPEHVSEPVAAPSGNPSYHVAIAKEVEVAPELRLSVELPADYPESVTPTISVDCTTSQRRIMTKPLLERLNSVATENIGITSVAALVQTAQDFLHELDSAAAAAARKAVDDAAEVDPTIRMGRTVTDELFRDWVDKFRAERAAAALAKLGEKSASTSKNKLTGRQLWDRTIKDADWQLFGAGTADEADDGDDVDYDFGDEEEEEAEAAE